VAITTNNKIGPFFSTHKGVRQGDPFSSLIFSVAADGSTCLIKQAQEMGLLVGLVPHITERGCTCLQHADDIIFLLQDNLEYAKSLTWNIQLGIKALRSIFIKVKFIALVRPSRRESFILKSSHVPSETCR
jgi:hypothetical protein